MNTSVNDLLNGWVDSMPKQTPKDYGCKDCPGTKQTDPEVIKYLKDLHNQ